MVNQCSHAGVQDPVVDHSGIELSHEDVHCYTSGKLSGGIIERGNAGDCKSASVAVLICISENAMAGVLA